MWNEDLSRYVIYPDRTASFPHQTPSMWVSIFWIPIPLFLLLLHLGSLSTLTTLHPYRSEFEGGSYTKPSSNKTWKFQFCGFSFLWNTNLFVYINRLDSLELFPYYSYWWSRIIQNSVWLICWYSIARIFWRLNNAQYDIGINTALLFTKDNFMP